MAQGLVKSKTKVVDPKNKRPTGPQTGNRAIKPKKAVLLKQQKMKNKHSAGLTTLTEKTLAEKAGHLELLKGGKRERDAKKAAKIIPRKPATKPAA